MGADRAREHNFPGRQGNIETMRSAAEPDQRVDGAAEACCAGSVAHHGAVLVSHMHGDVPIVAAGIVMALIYRRKRPEVYARIGRDDPAFITTDT
jgi:hypothetical protein